MTHRERTPGELEVFEELEVIVEERVEAFDRPAPEPEAAKDDPLQDIEPGDEDGLPDGPAKFRVPS